MPLLTIWHPGVKVNVDSAVVYIDLLPGTLTETEQFSDSAIVYLDLQPGQVYLQIDVLLEIVGNMSRWVIESPLARWTIGEPVARVFVLTAFLRWCILEMRRLTWRP